MKIETLHDILDWTRKLHQQLSNRLLASAAVSTNERSKMLLEYLADHEQKLGQLLDAFENESDAKALNSWCYEFFQNNEVLAKQQSKLSFDTMTSDQIVEEVAALHNQVIDVYRQLADQFEVPAATDVIQQLLALEQHEAMRLVQGSNRLQDI